MLFNSHRSVDLTLPWICYCLFLIVGSSGISGQAMRQRRPVNTVTQSPPTLAQRVESLENRVIIVEAGDYDRRITSLNSYIASEVFKLQDELDSTKSSLKVAKSDIEYLFEKRDSMSQEIYDMNTEIIAIKNSLTANDAEVDAMAKNLNALSVLIERLNATNQIWRANFVVVNKTFDKLRKKYNSGRR